MVRFCKSPDFCKSDPLLALPAEEMHGQPKRTVVATFDQNAVGFIIYDIQPRHFVVIQVKPAISFYLGKGLTEFAHANNVLSHEAQHRRLDFWVCQPFDLVDKVVGKHRATTGLSEVTDRSKRLILPEY